MVPGDLDAMLEWRPFADPLYQAFDFPRRSRAETVRWFEWRSRDPSRRLYTVEDEKRRVIGSLTLREMNGTQSARLGITLGADFVSQGYGKETLALFLGYYFETMGFEEMVLDVAATNLRAVRTYEALGFRHVSTHYRMATHPSFDILRRDPRYRHLQRFFRRRGNLHEVLFYDLALSRDDWRSRKAAGQARGQDG
jgi:RimJ/RimL family protein N-acetyltransferase